MPVIPALAAWFGMLALAVALGAARDLALAPLLGDGPARAACTALLCAVFWAVIRRFVRVRNVAGRARLLALGAFWAGLTVCFEFSMGWLRGMALSAMLADYDVSAGRLWVLVPLTLLFGPLAAGREKRRDAGQAPRPRNA